MIFTLISIAVFSTPSPSVTVGTTQFPDHQGCIAAMTAMAEGTSAIFRANVQAISGDVLIKKEGAWLLVLSGMQREIARFKCVES